MAKSFWLTCALYRYLTTHPCVLSSEPLWWSVAGPSQAPNDESEKNSGMLCGFEAEKSKSKVARAAGAEILPSVFFVFPWQISLRRQQTQKANPSCVQHFFSKALQRKSSKQNMARVFTASHLSFTFGDFTCRIQVSLVPVSLNPLNSLHQFLHFLLQLRFLLFLVLTCHLVFHQPTLLQFAFSLQFGDFQSFHRRQLRSMGRDRRRRRFPRDLESNRVVRPKAGRLGWVLNCLRSEWRRLRLWVERLRRVDLRSYLRWYICSLREDRVRGGGLGSRINPNLYWSSFTGWNWSWCWRSQTMLHCRVLWGLRTLLYLRLSCNRSLSIICSLNLSWSLCVLVYWYLTLHRFGVSLVFLQGTRLMNWHVTSLRWSF